MGDHPRKDTNTENNSSAKSHKKCADEFSGFCRDLTAKLNYRFTEHWLLSLLAAGAFGLIICALQSHFDFKPMTSGIIGLTEFAIVVCLAGWDVYRDRSKPPSPEFFVTRTWQDGGPGGHFWFVDDAGHNTRRVTNADCACLIEFTNLKKIPIMIAAYAISERTATGQWKEAKTFRLGYLWHGRIFVGSDLTRVNEIKYLTFDEAIENKSIAPNETVRGWMIFKRWPEGEFRFELRDMTGLVAAGLFRPSILEDFSVAQSSRFPAQPMLMTVNIDSSEDISALPKW